MKLLPKLLETVAAYSHEGLDAIRNINSVAIAKQKVRDLESKRDMAEGAVNDAIADVRIIRSSIRAIEPAMNDALTHAREYKASYEAEANEAKRERLRNAGVESLQEANRLKGQLADKQAELVVAEKNQATMESAAKYVKQALTTVRDLLAQLEKAESQAKAKNAAAKVVESVMGDPADLDGLKAQVDKANKANVQGDVRLERATQGMTSQVEADPAFKKAAADFDMLDAPAPAKQAA